MFPGREADAPEAEVREVRDDHFAVTLAILRIIRRMSQGDLAEKAVVTNSAVSDYERGKVDPQAVTLRKLFQGLDLPISVLDETRAFIERIRSQVGAEGEHRHQRLAALEAVDVTAVNAEEAEIWSEVAILAAEGGRFLSRFIRLLFLTLFWMARSSRRDGKGQGR
jgi:transcriptional regulator with XRE-family HTH domain